MEDEGGEIRGSTTYQPKVNFKDLNNTGGKDQCTRLVHCKYIAKKWTVYCACAHLVHHKYFQNFPCWFPHDVPIR